ncbi:MAG TPA: DUF2231 domain-containing protein [Gemmatimonadaceae bacterium]|nr:DUF2231 domain-containing protein [Gemmatimonadaceae bacterium]
MRLQEVHPALVHFPLAFIPLSIGADLIGRITGSEALMNLGKRTMPLAVASGLVAGAAGLIAQTEVEAEGVALDQLKTHRTLNLGLVTAAAAMSVYRARTEKPGLGYLLAGVAALVALDYSAYLGGAMVYQHGVGVDAANGVRTNPPVPELTPGSAADAARTAWTDLEKGIQMTVEETAKGDLVPALTRHAGNDASASAG